MKTTLIDLWNGRIAPFSEHSEYCDETQELIGLLDKNHKDLAARLDDKGKEILQIFEDNHGELLMLDCEDAFIKGFSLGVKLMVETMAKE